ncbi:hypothetical protein AKJ52_02825 [candidate division MSBL1 archaeon SCGC-AAA382C18]|uniref:UbiD family decarboxylase n=1 Tax=candidate division MSBL1 archaeon SCGC-AAA382C18 TaxID=1698281 RepID=A0A133VHN1_9EURY|nr:hypothetical protein AKJ52_02825 [candidate division MSBL1 archaeon SCGC-AAA382C18]
MKLEKDFEKILDKCERLEKYEKDILITAFLSKKFSKQVLVGEAASSWYSRGGYRTMDVDVIVVGEVEELEKGLKKLGFEENRVWHYSDAGFALDIVSRSGGPERTRTYEIDSYEIEIASPEDVIVNDLAGYKFWNQANDFDRAKLVYEAEKEDLDMEYLRERAKEEKIDDALRELL